MTTNTLQAGTELFPESVRELIGLLGLEAALILVKEYGGLVISIPFRNLGGEQGRRLAQLIGFEKAVELVGRYGGERLLIPRCVAAMKAIRNRKIVAEYSGGKPVRIISREYELSERAVWLILSTPEPAEVATIEKRDREIIAAYKAGSTLGQIAKIHKIGTDKVRKIVAGSEHEAAAQPF